MRKRPCTTPNLTHPFPDRDEHNIRNAYDNCHQRSDSTIHMGEPEGFQRIRYLQIIFKVIGDNDRLCIFHRHVLLDSMAQILYELMVGIFRIEDLSSPYSDLFMTVTKNTNFDSSEQHVYRLALVYRKKRSDHAYHLDGCIMNIHLSCPADLLWWNRCFGQRLSKSRIPCVFFSWMSA